MSITLQLHYTSRRSRNSTRRLGKTHLFWPGKNGAGDGSGDGSRDAQLPPARRDDRVRPPSCIAVAPGGSASFGTPDSCLCRPLAAAAAADPPALADASVGAGRFRAAWGLPASRAAAAAAASPSASGESAFQHPDRAREWLPHTSLHGSCTRWSTAHCVSRPDEGALCIQVVGLQLTASPAELHRLSLGPACSSGGCADSWPCCGASSRTSCCSRTSLKPCSAATCAHDSRARRIRFQTCLEDVGTDAAAGSVFSNPVSRAIMQATKGMLRRSAQHLAGDGEVQCGDQQVVQRWAGRLRPRLLQRVDRFLQQLRRCRWPGVRVIQQHRQRLAAIPRLSKHQFHVLHRQLVLSLA